MKEAPIIPMFKFQSGVLPFKVQTLKGFTEQPDYINEGPHSHNYYELVWLTKGTGTLYVDMGEQMIGSNTIFCLKPDQVHQFQIREGMDGFVFSFTDSFFKMDDYDFGWTGEASIFQLFSEGRAIGITHEMEEEMTEIVLKMIKELAN